MPPDQRPLDELSQEEIDQLSDEELMSRIEIEKSDRVKAQEYHQERSQAARVADESFRSTRVTDDYETWRAAPNEYDFEGVDTVAAEYKRRRAHRALGTATEKGLVSEFVEAESAAELPGSDKGATSERTRGTFEPGDEPKVGVRVDRGDQEQQAETLAHEVGHAVDYGDASVAARSMQGLGFDLDPVTTSEVALDAVGSPVQESEVSQEVTAVSEERRGEISEANRDYRDEPTELFADFFGSAITRPRNTKARAPKTRERVAAVFDEDEGKEQSQEFVEEVFPEDFLDEP